MAEQNAGQGTPSHEADTIIQRQEGLAAERSLIESQWQEIAELVRPMRADFTVSRGGAWNTTSRDGAWNTTARMPGEKRLQRVFDGTPGTAADNLAAGLWGMITNSANNWFGLAHPVEELNREESVKLWLDEASRRMRNAFSANGQRFYAKAMELYLDQVSFGTGVFYTDEMPDGSGLFFSCRHLAECYISENAHEKVDTLYRRFLFTARQAYGLWGEAAGENIVKAHDKEPERKFEFIHAVYPRDDYNPRKLLDRRGKAFRSCYVNVEKRCITHESGYFEFPYQVARWSTASRGTYGDSPAMLALPDIKMLNAMSKTTIIAAQKVADPPILTIDERGLRGARTTPGGFIYSGLDKLGNPRYRPLETNANIGLGLEMEQQRRAAIKEAFYGSLLLMVAQPNMTAAEWLGRQEEKLRLMGPHLGRIQSEFLDPLIDRVFALMFRAGKFPAPPEILKRYPEIRVEYVSPLARAQKASEGAAIVRTFEALAPIGQANPDVYDNFDGDQVAQLLADAYGLPPRAVRDPKRVAQLRQQKSQAMQMAALAQAAPGLGKAMKDATQAGAIGLNAGKPAA